VGERDIIQAVISTLRGAGFHVYQCVASSWWLLYDKAGHDWHIGFLRDRIIYYYGSEDNLAPRMELDLNDPECFDKMVNYIETTGARRL
jgi:hypothetical protein